MGNADLCGSASTDYYSVIFTGFVNTGLAISLSGSQVDLSWGIFLGFFRHLSCLSHCLFVYFLS